MSTETVRNWRVDQRFVTPLLIGLYLATVSVPRVLGSGGAVRLKLLVEAVVFVAILGGLGLLVLTRGRVRIHREYLGLFWFFAGFLVMSLLGLAIGFVHGYPSSYIIGDYYKFAIPVLAVFGIYVAAESSESFHRAFSGVHALYLLLLLGALALYLGGFLETNQRLGFLYQFPTILVLSYWLMRRGNPVARSGFPLLVLATLPVIYYTQSLSLLLQILLVTTFTIIYYRTIDLSELVSMILGLGIAAVGFGFVAFVGLNQIPASELRQFGYLGTKLTALVGDYSLYERLILLGGSRAAEPFGVFNAINGGIFELLFGIGLGSTFVVTSPFPTSNWVGADHFVHSGFWEAVLRTGLIGGLFYLGFVLSYLYTGFQIRQDSYLGALVAADATVILLFLPFTGTIFGTQFFTFALFAYALVRWGESRRETPHNNES